MSIQSFWIEENGSQIYVTYYPAAKLRSSVLIAPPIGPVYMHSKATLRKLALKLSSNGFSSWSFDWPGYGNSCGSLPVENSIEVYADTLQLLSKVIHEYSGCKPVLVTLCSSSLVTYKALQNNSLSAWVQWYPYSQGASFIRDLELIDAALSDTDRRSDLITAGGYPLFRKDAEQYSVLKLSSYVPTNAIPILCIHGPESKRQPFLKPYEEQGCGVSKHTSSELAQMARQAEYSIPAINDIAYINDWLNNLALSHEKSVNVSVPFPNHVNFGDVKEEVIRLGKRHLFGVLTIPTNAEAQNCLIIPNTGAGHHAGPNGLHTLMARKLAQNGFATLRLDIENLGDSGDEFDANNNDAYTAHAAENIAEFVNKYLQARFPKISIFGLCSGAYSAFQYVIMDENPRISKLFLANVNTLYWQPGEDTATPEDAKHSIDDNYYKSQARNISAWVDLLTKPSKWLRIMAKLISILKNIINRFKRAISGATTQLEADVSSIVERGILFHFYFNKDEPGIEMLKQNTGRTFQRLIEQNKVNVSISSDGDHTFTSIKARSDLINAVIRELSD